MASPEDELIAWLRRRPQTGRDRLIGDDAAVLPADERFAVTVDSQIEGVHFVRGLEPEVLARRLLAVNLSDIAAMGGRPAYAFLALAAPTDFDHRGFFRALLAAAEDHGLVLAGGDLAANQQIVATLTLIGEKDPDAKWLRRSGAVSGDRLWLGGSLGESAAGAVLVQLGACLAGGEVRLPNDFESSPEICQAARHAVLRHLLPRPQLTLGRFLSRRPRSAAIDISDGLARDLHRLCRESGTGAEIDLERLPLTASFQDLAGKIDRDWTDLALAGGEDYVLLFTLPTDDEPPAELGASAIGRIIAEREISLIDRGERSKLEPRGWDHLAPKEKSPATRRGFPQS